MVPQKARSAYTYPKRHFPEDTWLVGAVIWGRIGVRRRIWLAGGLADLVGLQSVVEDWREFPLLL